ncbi:hypothetical protein Bca101_025779 [Brassica carinata]
MPTRDVNVIPEDGSEAPRLVERNFDLPAAIDRHDSGGSPSLQDFGHHAGYYKLPNSKAARMFYYFFRVKKQQSRSCGDLANRCSSELALFYETDRSPSPTTHLFLGTISVGTRLASNLIYVDQPVGTGFSYKSDESDLRHDEDGVSNDLYDFLQGFAIGNGLTNPEIQYAAYADYALDMKLISQSDHDNLDHDYETCAGGSGEACASSYVFCYNIFQKIMNIAGNVNYYDVRKQCKGSLCYDFSNMEKFLNQKSVRKALGVGGIEFVSCSTAVYDAMQLDWMRNLEVGIPALLEDGIKMLIYAGEYDLICNWLGNSKWVHEMEWSGRKEFVADVTVPFHVDNKEAGLMKNHGSLTFLKVHDAGHMVPMDQPKAALQMLQD